MKFRSRRGDTTKQLLAELAASLLGAVVIVVAVWLGAFLLGFYWSAGLSGFQMGRAAIATLWSLLP